jgi:hypothetical protein
MHVFGSRALSLLLLVIYSTWVLQALANDAGFGRLLAQPASGTEPDHIPKKVHFVFVNLKPLSWMEYAAVKSSTAFDPESINLWIPAGDAQPPGPIWERVLAIDRTVLRRMEMPSSVYGIPVRIIQHVSDVSRLKIIYEEGGKPKTPRPCLSRRADRPSCPFQASISIPTSSHSVPPTPSYSMPLPEEPSWPWRAAPPSATPSS